LQALNTAILEQQAVVETTRIQAEGQIKAAERNAKYLQTFLDFVTFPQRKLAEFFEGFVNGSIDILNKLGLGIEKIDVTGVFDDVNNFIVKQIFDPEAERKNQEKIVKDAEKNLISLNNQRDGILNAQDAKEKAAREKAASDARTAEEKAAAEIKAIRDKELADELARIDALNEARKKANEERIAQEEAQFALLQSLTLNAQQKEIQAAVKLAEERLIIAGTDANLQKLVAEERDKSITEINAKYAQAQVDTTKAANDAEVQSAQEAEAKKIQTRQESFAKGLDLAQNAIAVLQAFSDASTKNSERDARRKFKTDKALAIGAATVQTASAVTGALTAGGNPIKLATGQQFVEASIAAALGLAQIIKIKNSQFGGGATGGNDTTPSVPSTGSEGGGAQPAQFNPLAASFLQDRPEQLTPRAYVLAGDVASAQEVRENVADLARIG
jgi:chemotaxis protein histidine kinase CheA